MDSIFGDFLEDEYPIIAVQACLEERLNHYLAVIARRRGLTSDVIPPVKMWDSSPTFGAPPEDHLLPLGLIIMPDTFDYPTRDGKQIYTMRWTIGVAVVVSAGPETQKVARVYGTAVRLCMVQSRSLGGRVTDLLYIGTSYDDLPTEDNRSVAAANCGFVIECENAMDGRGGPKTFPSDPYVGQADPPVIDTVTTNINQGAL